MPFLAVCYQEIVSVPGPTNSRSTPDHSMSDASRWESRYQSGDLPWDTGRPNLQLAELVKKGGVPVGRVLDVGCGTGTNSIWLAGRGFDVLGLDISETAVAMARTKADEQGCECRFEVGDIFVEDSREDTFDFVFDMGCFHTFDDPVDQAALAARIASLLKPGKPWLSIVGSTDGPARQHGPPRRSATDIVTAVERHFEIESLVRFWFDENLPSPTWGWRVLLRRRGGPAQPSTVRAKVSEA